MPDNPDQVGLRDVPEELLRKYNKPGPRYTSYPTAVEFSGEFGPADYGEALSEAAERSDEPLALYFHLPFCRNQCLFCACNVVIGKHEGLDDVYLDHVETELEMVAERLGDRRDAMQMHWGGGTPTFLDPDNLARLFEMVTDRFTFRDGAEIALEVDPRVTTREQMKVLGELGFNRLSMGVQDFDREVQEHIDRLQTFEMTRELMEQGRELGFEGINTDLIFGLPKQTPERFRATVEKVIQLEPSRIALYSFAYVPWIKPHQKKLDEDAIPEPEEKFELFNIARRKFMEAGYRQIGMDHFALPEDELSQAQERGELRRNFMGYTVVPASDMLAFGITGIGNLRHRYVQNEKKLSRYYEALEDGELPTMRGYQLDFDDRVRAHTIHELMCNFVAYKDEVEAEFDVEFDNYFSDALEYLQPLIEDGLVENDPDAVRVTPMGRNFIRNICMKFDAYLDEEQKEEQVFSKTV